MNEELWAGVVVAVASIVGIILSQFWNHRTLKGQLVLQARFSFFEEAYKDNVRVFHSLSQIENGVNIDQNINKIQSLIDGRPYNFPFRFRHDWCHNKEGIAQKDAKKSLSVLYDDIQKGITVYGAKFLKETVGVKPNESEDILDAMR